MNVETLRVLVAKGMSAQDILEVAEAMSVKQDRTAAERQARHRAKKAEERNIVTRDVTRDDNEELASPPKTPTPPNTPPIIPPNSDEFGAPPAGDASSDDDESLKPEHVVEAWNDLAARLGKPRIRALTPERRIRLKSRIAGYSLDEFREVFGNVEASPFLRGDKGWTGCTFDWITKKANFQKILEGNYNG